MAATITLNLDDQTAKGIQGLVDNAGEAQEAMKSLVNHMKQLQDESGKVGKLSDAFGNVSQKITAVSTATLATLEVFKKGFEAAKKFVDVVNRLADEGNPAAKELQSAFQDVKTAMMDIANDPLVQDMLKGLAEFISNELIPILTSIPDKWREAQNWIAESISATTDFLGITEGAAEASREMAAQQERATAAAKERAAQAAQEEKNEKGLQHNRMVVEEGLAKIEEAKRQTADRDALAKNKNMKDLEAQRDKEVADLKKFAETMLQTDEQRNEGLTKVAQIEQRISDLKKEQVEANKKFVDGVKQQFDIAAKAAKDTFAKMAAEAAKNLDAVMAKERKAVDGLAGKIVAMRKALTPGGKEQDIVGAIKQQLDPRAVTRQIGENRARKAAQEVEAGGGSARDAERAATRARESAFRQARAGGQFSPEEMNKATTDLTQQVISGAASSGKLNQTQAKALQQATETIQQQNANIEQLASDTEAILKALEGEQKKANGTGRRMRAQRGSGG